MFCVLHPLKYTIVCCVLNFLKKSFQSSIVETEPSASTASASKKAKVSISFDLQEDDTFETKDNRERSPSPPKNDISVYVRIDNLVRPFVVRQLKSLIAKSATIVEEDGFWINNIKSKCYVKVCLCQLIDFSFWPYFAKFMSL